MENLSADNRRQHKRIIVSSPTRVDAGGEEIAGRILNISAGGAGIQLDVQLKDHSQIKVNIQDLGMIPATVVRKLQDGVAVKFQLSEEKEKLFIDMIENIVQEKRKSGASKVAV